MVIGRNEFNTMIGKNKFDTMIRLDQIRNFELYYIQ